VQVLAAINQFHIGLSLCSQSVYYTQQWCDSGIASPQNLLTA